MSTYISAEMICIPLYSSEKKNVDNKRRGLCTHYAHRYQHPSLRNSHRQKGETRVRKDDDGTHTTRTHISTYLKETLTVSKLALPSLSPMTVCTLRAHTPAPIRCH